MSPIQSTRLVWDIKMGGGGGIISTCIEVYLWMYLTGVVVVQAIQPNATEKVI